jgi:hypothetical protein
MNREDGSHPGCPPVEMRVRKRTASQTHKLTMCRSQFPEGWQLGNWEAFEGLELWERKLSCTVLRGLDGSNPVRLLGSSAQNLKPARPALWPDR